VLGLYGGQLFGSPDRSERVRLRQLQTWVIVLMAWPVLLLLFPFQDSLIRLVGLRGSIFFLPFLLLGARLEARDLHKLVLGIAVLNLCAAALAGVEFFVGIERVFPRNATTEIIYRSNDLGHFSEYRIPASFPNAHAYAGTMVMTMPLLLGAWQLVRRPQWQGVLIAAASLASALGVFMAAARSHAFVLFLMALVMTVSTFTNRSQSAYRLRWLILVGCIGWAVSADDRLQRFATLSDTEYVGRRLAGSVNMTFFDVISTYPIGNGLGGGGTSVPYFLQGRLEHPVWMENEYARIALEQGIPGLCLWVAFLIWVFTRSVRIALETMADPWHLARRLAWVGCVGNFALGLTGTGLFTSVPQTCLMLLTVGWIAVRAPVQPRPAILERPARRDFLAASYGTSY
jgi:hypothetical protein